MVHILRPEIPFMPAKRKGAKKSAPASTLRASVSFPPELYHTLENIARHKKVSLAWVMRDAAEKYVVGQSRELKGQ
jgi:predicted DNA-binding ribbon-helix-helix protein